MIDERVGSPGCANDGQKGFSPPLEKKADPLFIRAEETEGNLLDQKRIALCSWGVGQHAAPWGWGLRALFRGLHPPQPPGAGGQTFFSSPKHVFRLVWGCQVAQRAKALCL